LWASAPPPRPISQAHTLTYAFQSCWTYLDMTPDRMISICGMKVNKIHINFFVLISSSTRSVIMLNQMVKFLWSFFYECIVKLPIIDLYRYTGINMSSVIITYRYNHQHL
jgi:hypothetical protein